MSPTKKRKPAPRDRGGVIYAIGLSPELVAEARAKAKSERWTMSQVIRRLLRLWLDGRVKIEDARDGGQR